MSYLQKSLLYFLKGLVLFYRYTLSSLIGRQCRYMPSCSEYALDALNIHGPFRGSWLALKRIGRCNPWGGSGYDPVPSKEGCECEQTEIDEPYDPKG